MEKEQVEHSNAAGDSPRQDVAASSRRRLLRAGLKATPIVVATLASRPSLACHCIVPSAWGSINAAMPNGVDVDINGNNNFPGSLSNRFKDDVKRVSDNVYKFSSFSESGRGWDYFLGDGVFSFPDNVVDLGRRKKIAYLQGKDISNGVTIDRLTVEGLCTKLKKPIVVPAGAGAKYPLALINEGYSSFGASMLIALINQHRGTRIIPSACYNLDSTNMLALMATGSYSPKDISQTWNEAQIGDYLHYNWFARRS